MEFTTQNKRILTMALLALRHVTKSIPKDIEDAAQAIGLLEEYHSLIDRQKIFNHCMKLKTVLDELNKEAPPEVESMVDGIIKAEKQQNANLN